MRRDEGCEIEDVEDEELSHHSQFFLRQLTPNAKEKLPQLSQSAYLLPCDFVGARPNSTFYINITLRLNPSQ